MRIKILSFMCMFLIGLAVWTTKPFSVYADSSDLYYDHTSVINDLSKDLHNNEDTNTIITEGDLVLHYNNSGKYDLNKISLIKFIEYGFGTDDMSLYFYVFNPNADTDRENNKIVFLENSIKNKVHLGYTNEKEDVLKVNYDKYSLTLIDISDNGYFAKYKLSDNNFKFDKKNESRNYIISGIELLTFGDVNATEYNVGRVYNCYCEYNETIITDDVAMTMELDDLVHTFYRTTKSNLDINNVSRWGTQLSSCYFSLPLNVEDKSYNLTAIDAEFENRFTEPILIVKDKNLYKRANSILNSSLEWNEILVPSSFLLNSNVIAFTLATQDTLGFEVPYFSEVSIGGFCPAMFGDIDWSTPSFSVPFTLCVKSNLSWVLPSGGYDSENNPKFEQVDFTSENFRYSGKYIKDYYYNAVNSQNGNKQAIQNLETLMFDNDGLHTMYYYDFFKMLSTKNFNLSLCGFPYNTKIRQKYTINSENYTDLKPDELTSVFTLKLQEGDFWASIFGFDTSSFINILPLEKVKYSDIFDNTSSGAKQKLSDEKISKKYFIDKFEIPNFLETVKKNYINGRDTWIFRYDACNYFGSPCYVYGKANAGFLAMESVYLGFDVISFDFMQENGETITIPISYSPTDVFNDLSGQAHSYQSSIFSIIIALILVLVFFLFFGKYVVAFILYPFKVISDSLRK